MRKATAIAQSDIAFIKYWGKKDKVLRLPENGSIAMLLDGLDTTTTVEFQPKLRDDVVTINGTTDDHEKKRVVAHLDRVRKLAGITTKAQVVSKNSFPKSTGLSSSSSGFAALTYAAVAAAELQLNDKEITILARQGSGSACRAAVRDGGFVEWLDGDTSDTSYAVSLHPAEYWDLRDVVAIVDEGKKRVSTTEGQESAQSSLVFKERQAHLPAKIRAVKQALAHKNFSELGQLIEHEALEFHSILLTSRPPLIAWYPGTVQVMLEVQQLRSEGIECYFTINTGFNVHVITLPQFEVQVKTRLAQLPLVKKTLLAKVGSGPKLLDRHLF